MCAATNDSFVELKTRCFLPRGKRRRCLYLLRLFSKLLPVVILFLKSLSGAARYLFLQCRPSETEVPRTEDRFNMEAHSRNDGISKKPYFYSAFILALQTVLLRAGIAAFMNSAKRYICYNSCFTSLCGSYSYQYCIP